MTASKALGLAYAVGGNESGELGLGHTRRVLGHQPIRHFASGPTQRVQGYLQPPPDRVPAPPLDAAACGYRYTVGVTGGRHLYSCGLNDSGQLGHGDSYSQFPAPTMWAVELDEENLNINAHIPELRISRMLPAGERIIALAHVLKSTLSSAFIQ
jgi:alpha-tubulin suppressor-like RCC1 family protein